MKKKKNRKIEQQIKLNIENEWIYMFLYTVSLVVKPLLHDACDDLSLMMMMMMVIFTDKYALFINI